MGKSASKDFQEVAGFLSEEEAHKYVEKAQKLLKKIHKQYPFLETLEEAACVADIRKEDQPLIYVNKHFQWMTLYPREEIIGKNCRFLQGKYTSKKTVKQIKEAISSSLPLDVEILNYRKDSVPFWNNFVLLPVFNKCKRSQNRSSTFVTHYLAIQKDVTFLKQGRRELSEWSCEEFVFHMEARNYPEKLIDMFFKEEIKGSDLHKITSGNELKNILGQKSRFFSPETFSRLFEEIEQLKRDPFYFKDIHSQIRTFQPSLELNDVYEVRRSVDFSLIQGKQANNVPPPIKSLSDSSVFPISPSSVVSVSSETEITGRSTFDSKQTEINYVTPGGTIEKVNFDWIPEKKLFWDTSTGSDYLKKNTICLKLKYFSKEVNENTSNSNRPPPKFTNSSSSFDVVISPSSSSSSSVVSSTSSEEDKDSRSVEDDFIDTSLSPTSSTTSVNIPTTITTTGVQQKLLIVERNCSYEKLQKLVADAIGTTKTVHFRGLKETEILSPTKLCQKIRDESEMTIDLVVSFSDSTPSSLIAFTQYSIRSFIQSLEVQEEMDLYDRLESFISESPFEVLDQLENFTYSVQEKLIKPILRILQLHDKSSDLVRKSLERQIMKTIRDTKSSDSEEQLKTLFRESSLATLLFGEFHFIVAKQYLVNLMSPLYHKIVNSPEAAYVEVISPNSSSGNLNNMTKGDDKKLKKFQEFLLSLLSELLASLTSSVNLLPVQLINIYRSLYFNLKPQFSSNKLHLIFQSIIVSFFFLRFLSPSLVSPEKYNIFFGTPGNTPNTTPRGKKEKLGKVDSDKDLLGKEKIASLVMKEISFVLQKLVADSRFSEQSWRSYFNNFISESQFPLKIFFSQMLHIPETLRKRNDDLTVLAAYIKTKKVSNQTY